jgi:CysZ protein
MLNCILDCPHPIFTDPSEVSLFDAISRALRDLFRPRILAVLFLPMAGAILLWSILLWLFWDTWREGLRVLIDATIVGAWLAAHADWFLSATTIVLIFAIVLPATFVTAVVLTELVAMPVIVSVVAREFPQLQRKGKGSAIGSMANAGAGVLIFIALWIVTLPLWLTGVGALFVPALNSGYLNQRLFRYDALAEHATPDEYRAIVTRTKGSLYMLGVLVGLLYYVPVVNLVAPVLSGLAFTHFCLRKLDRMRADRR